MRIQPLMAPVCSAKGSAVLCQRAAARWHRTAEPFAEHTGAIRGWIRISGLDFEKAITRILKTRGFDAHATKASGDGGVDIEILANGHLDTVVQCKRYK